MINEKIKLTRKEKVIRKQTAKILKMMEQSRRNGLISKEKYDQYKAMINEDEKVIDKAKEDLNGERNKDKS